MKDHPHAPQALEEPSPSAEAKDTGLQASKLPQAGDLGRSEDWPEELLRIVHVQQHRSHGRNQLRLWVIPADPERALPHRPEYVLQGEWRPEP